ncbi:MAG: DUF805 domain-containing protein [Lentisphaeria bacterium]|nr:DUF805 domain-containing protein [Lentisphaeria bacterium]
MSENTAETPEKSVNAFTAFEHYDDFKGKATRAEFWSFFLLVHVVILLLMIPAIPVFFRESANEAAAATNWHTPLALALPMIIWGLLVIIPLFSALVRRINATEKKFRIYYIVAAVAVIALGVCSLVFSWIGLAAVLFWVFELLMIGGGVLPEEETPANA